MRRRISRFWEWIDGAWGLCALVAMGLGAYLRAVHYLDSRSLWLDEAMLGLNIASRSARELFEPLDYHQVVPPLFLLIERFAVVIGGVSELVMRAFPMLCGMGVLALAWPLARRLLGSPEALLATVWMAFSPLLIRYGNELKPYGSDALATCVLLLSALAVIRTPSSGCWLALGACGVASLLLSLPAVFVCAAIVVALAVRSETWRGRAWWLVAIAGVWGLTLGLLYLGFYRLGATNPYLHQGYEGAFLVPGPELTARLGWALQGTLLSPFPVIEGGWGSPMWLVSAILAAGLFGIWSRNGGSVASLLWLPMVVAALASSLWRYPFGVPRMMVFAGPLVLLAAAGSLTAIGRGLQRWRRVQPVVLAVLIGAAAIPAARAAWASARDPLRIQDTAALVEDFRKRPRTDEPVYVGARGIPAWLFYTTDWERPDRERLRFYAREATWGRCFENAPSRGRRVVNEGSGLVYQRRQRKEILGLASGRQWRYPTWVTAIPDEGWAENEAARIAHLANPCAWLFFSQLSDMTHKRVMWHLRDDYGARRRYERYERGSVLWRFCLPKYGPQATPVGPRPAGRLPPPGSREGADEP